MAFFVQLILRSYPLLQLPIVKDVPVDRITLREDEFQSFENSHLIFSYGNQNRSLGYTLQIVLHASVVHNQTNKCFPSYQLLADALQQSFKVVQFIREFRSSGDVDSPNGRSFEDICFQVEDHVLPDKENEETIYNTLPTFGCLLLAPTLLWNNDPTQLVAESTDLIARLRDAAAGDLRSLSFGFPWKMTGINLSPVCSQNDGIVFAVTLVFREYDPRFITELRTRLASHFTKKADDHELNNEAEHNTTAEEANSNASISLPFLKSEHEGSEPTVGHIYLVWYRGRSYLSDYAPLIVIYVVLLLYVYFSVRKLEMVKSKWGLAFSACFTVVASLLMSMGICVTIGLMVPTLNGSEIFPYLVVLIGFENVIILTKSVVATPIDLPVKYRIAQGLMKESWSLTKHYFTQFVLLGFGFFTLHPIMQEFCLFAVVGLTTDCFLQLFFFVTVLSVDIRRMELSDLSTQYPSFSLLKESQTLLSTEPAPSRSAPAKQKEDGGATADVHFRHIRTLAASVQSWLVRVRSLCARQLYPSWLKFWLPIKTPFKRGHKRKVSAAQAAAFLASDERAAENVPRRLRVLRSWAKHRLFQRLLMFCLSVWIILFMVYAVDVVQVALDVKTFFSSKFTKDDRLPATRPSVPVLEHDPTSLLSQKAAEMLMSGFSENRNINTTTEDHSVSDEGRLPQVRYENSASTLSEFRHAHPFSPPTEHAWDVMLLWNYLAFFQWPLLAKHYNFSLAGCHLALLEPIHLQHYIHPTVVSKLDETESITAQSVDITYGDSGLDPSKRKLDWSWATPGGFHLPDSAGFSSAAQDKKLVGSMEDFLLGKSKLNGPSPTSSGGLASWTTRLSLTVSMLGTSVLGCGLVVLVTCLGMIFFQEWQSKSCKSPNREPVIRVLPLTISLLDATDSAPPMEGDAISKPEWTLACGKIPKRSSDGTQMEGVIAASCIPAWPYSIAYSSDVIKLWSTGSGLPMTPLLRYSADAMLARQNASPSFKRLCHRHSTVWSICFLPNGYLVVGCSDGTMEVWDCDTSSLKHLLSLEYPVSPMLSPDDLENNEDDSQNVESSLSFSPALTAQKLASSVSHPGGITVLKPGGYSSFAAGTSRGYLAWFILNTTSQSPTASSKESSSATVVKRQWHVHSRPVTQLAFMPLTRSSLSSSSDLSYKDHQKIPGDEIILISAAEDGQVLFTLSNMDEPLYRFSVDSTAIVSLDYLEMAVAVSHASGSLYVAHFELTTEIHDSGESDSADPSKGRNSRLSCTLNILDQILLATRETDAVARSRFTRASNRVHPGSIGLKLFLQTKRPSAGHDTVKVTLNDFRLVTCELDNTLAIWNLKSAKVVRSFRLNLSTLSPSGPLVSVDDRVVFGDQGYLRVVNPWTTKYERSVQLLPPSTALFRNSTNVSSSILSAVLRKWSRELVPIGIAGERYDPCAATCKSNSAEHVNSDKPPHSSAGSVMVSLAESGQTIVIIPLATLQTL
ncbi:unnamed protein product [Calicophoron daubneyi]|uniref:Sterol regulatory element-binding protein cleavage-activating protein n=1 Tax=Calicophoron daubneyi TaxID=300641 RepID=A0AAV2THM6_CALDB